MNNKYYKYAFILFATLILTAVHAEEDRFAGVEIKTQEVAEGIYMLIRSRWKYRCISR